METDDKASRGITSRAPFTTHICCVIWRKALPSLSPIQPHHHTHVKLPEVQGTQLLPVGLKGGGKERMKGGVPLAKGTSQLCLCLAPENLLQLCTALGTRAQSQQGLSEERAVTALKITARSAFYRSECERVASPRVCKQFCLRKEARKEGTSFWVCPEGGLEARRAAAPGLICGQKGVVG